MTDPKNPFVHHLKLSKLQMLKVGVFGITLVPLRLLLAFLCCTVTTALAVTSVYGFTDKDIEAAPFTGWRRTTRLVIAKILRFMFFCCGFCWVKTRGRQATPEEAPIIVVAPHSSFFDVMAVVLYGGPSVVAKSEASNIPFWGSLIRCTQPVLVRRNDPNSRQNTIKQIVDRSSPGSGWQQIFIFPEGTCTNRSSLITFRLGSFYPGVPVQPVCVRYNNGLNSVTWTWEGISTCKVVLYSLSQLYLNMEIEYMPPYVPDAREREDPKLFASNVRSVMAQSLNIPTTDCSYFDYLRIEKAQEGLAKLQKLQKRMESTITEKTKYVEKELGAEQCLATRVALAERLGVTEALPELEAVCDMFTRGEEVEVRQLRVAGLVAEAEDGLVALREAFALFDKELGDSAISCQSLIDILQFHLFLSPKEAVAVSVELDQDGRVEADSLLDYLITSKPNYVKVIRAVEGQLSKRDLIVLSASRTAEMMAASGSRLLSSGKEVVSDVSAKMAAGREKMTDALSSSAAAGAAAFSLLSATTSTATHRKSKSE